MGCIFWDLSQMAYKKHFELKIDSLFLIDQIFTWELISTLKLKKLVLYSVLFAFNMVGFFKKSIIHTVYLTSRLQIHNSYTLLNYIHGVSEINWLKMATAVTISFWVKFCLFNLYLIDFAFIWGCVDLLQLVYRVEWGIYIPMSSLLSYKN